MSTHCNQSHCAWRSATGLTVEPVDPWAWRLGVPELRVELKSAGSKGLGVFAAQAAGPGRWVCGYNGEVLNLTALLDRYANERPSYVYRLSASLSIDARDSTHHSRYINHDATPNLQVSISKLERRIDIFAKRPLAVGQELTIDYGLSYWRARSEAPEGTAHTGRDVPTTVDHSRHKTNFALICFWFFTVGTESRRIERHKAPLRKGCKPWQEIAHETAHESVQAGDDDGWLCATTQTEHDSVAQSSPDVVIGAS
jgi:hypothetical protein